MITDGWGRHRQVKVEDGQFVDLLSSGSGSFSDSELAESDTSGTPVSPTVTENNRKGGLQSCIEMTCDCVLL